VAAPSPAAAAIEAAHAPLQTLDAATTPADRSAAIIAVWQAVEAALQLFAADHMSTGQTLVRDLRQSNLVTMGEGHRLIDLIAVRDRAQQSGYQATDEDVAATHAAVDQLTASDTTPAPSVAPVPPPAAAAVPSAEPVPELPAAPVPAATTVASGGHQGMPVLLVMLGVLVAACAGLYYLASSGRVALPASVRGIVGGSALSRGVDAFAAGRVDEARGDFQAAVREDSMAATPHIYLARIARESRDLVTARGELVTAIRLAPNDAVAQREMGSYLLAARNPELARRFYVRAVTLDSSDRAAEGYLGCALVQLHRSSEAAPWFARAGSGPWTACGGAPASSRGDSTHRL
jgi:hypothetical protein